MITFRVFSFGKVQKLASTVAIGLLIAGFTVFHVTTSSFAQETLYNYGITLNISDPDVVVGDLVTRNDTGEIVRSSEAFDPRIIGVRAESATVLYRTDDDQSVPIVTSGQTIVSVTTIGGEIESGDALTSSPIAGKGQRSPAVQGFVFGYALEGFDETAGTEVEYEGETFRQGQILAEIAIGGTGNDTQGVLSRLVDQIGYLIFRSTQVPQQNESFWRFILAAVITLLSVGISFGTFGRSIARGVEAMGRNPLAKRQIQAMIITNAIVVAAISIGGVILSLAIIRF